MTTVTVDGDTYVLMDDGTTEIRDSEGRRIGRCGPLFPGSPMARVAEEVGMKVDWEELKQERDPNEKCYTMAEVQARLAALEAETNRRKAAGDAPLTDDEAVAFVLSVPGSV